MSADNEKSYEFGQTCGRLVSKWLSDVAVSFGDYVESDIPYLLEVASEIGWDTLCVEDFDRLAFEDGAASSCLAYKHIRTSQAERKGEAA